MCFVAVPKVPTLAHRARLHVKSGKWRFVRTPVPIWLSAIYKCLLFTVCASETVSDFHQLDRSLDTGGSSTGPAFHGFYSRIQPKKAGEAAHTQPVASATKELTPLMCSAIVSHSAQLLMWCCFPCTHSLSAVHSKLHAVSSLASCHAPIVPLHTHSQGDPLQMEGLFNGILVEGINRFATNRKLGNCSFVLQPVVSKVIINYYRGSSLNERN